MARGGWRGRGSYGGDVVEVKEGVVGEVDASGPGIRWEKEWEVALARSREEGRPVLVDVGKEP